MQSLRAYSGGTVRDSHTILYSPTELLPHPQAPELLFSSCASYHFSRRLSRGNPCKNIEYFCPRCTIGGIRLCLIHNTDEERLVAAAGNDKKKRAVEDKVNFICTERLRTLCDHDRIGCRRASVLVDRDTGGVFDL